MSLRRRMSWNRPGEKTTTTSSESLEEYGLASPNVDLEEPTITDEPSKVNYTFECKSLMTESVTVYVDRADVTRKALVQCNERGVYEVCISKVPLSVDDSSIRVATSNTKSKILEVSVKNLLGTISDEKKAQIDMLTKERESLNRKLERVRMQLGWLQSYASSTSGTPMPPSGGIAPVRINTDEANVFLQFYSQRLEETIEGGEEVNDRIMSIDKRISELSRKEESKDIRFTFYLEEASEFTFSISYVVRNASWRPSYDIRVKSSVLNLIELTYNGIITNNSGDNWIDTQISLSTSQPQIGAHPPNISTLNVKLKSEQPNTVPATILANAEGVPVHVTTTTSTSKKKHKEETLIEKGITSSSFLIERKTTIPSDSKPHKVTIKIIELVSHFSYTIIPLMSRNAYLRATCLNESSYTFLPGKMNVYMDGTFISASEIKLTNPTDELTLFLGVDQSIVVDCKETFVRENKGVVLANKSVVNKYSHIITIKNLKNEAVSVSVYDQLPKSQDSKIKVNVLKPVMREDNPEVKLCDTNNFRWSKKIEPAQDYKIEFEYTIEFPSTSQLAFN